MTWQISPKTKFSAYMDEIDKFRGHDMQALYDPEDSGHRVELAGLQHERGEVDARRVTQPAALRRRVLEQHRVLHERVPGGHRRAPRHAGWFLTRVGNEELDLGGQKNARTLAQITQSPLRHTWNASASYVSGSHNLKVGTQVT